MKPSSAAGASDEMRKIAPVPLLMIIGSAFFAGTLAFGSDSKAASNNRAESVKGLRAFQVRIPTLPAPHYVSSGTYAEVSEGGRRLRIVNRSLHHLVMKF